MLLRVMQPFAIFAAASAFAVACSPSGGDVQDGPVTPLAIETAQGSHSFSVEIADDNAERGQGLMNRHSMSRDHGMLFIYEKDQPVSFWMKNTYIPLDLIFISSDGVVRRVSMNAEPHDLEGIPSGEPVRAVLEVNAGTAIALGIKSGDRIRHAAFGTAP